MMKKQNLIGAGVIVLVSIGSFFFWKYWDKHEALLANREGVTDDSVQNIQFPLPTPQIQSPDLPSVMMQNDPEAKPLYLSVVWSTPVEISQPDIIKKDHFLAQDDTYFFAEVAKKTHFYKLGTVTGDTYDGATVLLVKTVSEGPGGDNYQKMLQTKDGYVVFGGSGLQYYFDASKIKIDVGHTFATKDTEVPRTIQDKQTGKTFLLPYTAEQQGPFKGAFGQQDKIFFDPKGLTLAFTDPVVGPVYFASKNQSSIPQEYSNHGFYVGLPDGSFVTYGEQFFGNKELFSFDTFTPPITWNGGIKNTAKYVPSQQTGCGTQYLVDVVNDEAGINDLVFAGKADTGEKIFLLKDENAKSLKQFFEEVNNATNGRYAIYSPMSYRQFIDARPFLFMIDPYGRIVRFFSDDVFQPTGGCGKPVIYLYPQNAETVSVKIAPQGGFTKTEPAYGTGWTVFAKPNGELKNLSDGKSYPYLFWEGHGGLYQTPDKGFVVAQNDVHTFLVSKLTELGLNTKETADFIEFWEPRMTGSPYYFVTFLGNQTMDQIAPLSISPKPDTVIRILMDFTPLTTPKHFDPITIHTPIRKGFTVVEWGGVLR
ncbi:MAG: hypothetical protein WCG55_03680 [bacterium]